MAWPNRLVRNSKNFKIVLSELSPNLQSWTKVLGRVLQYSYSSVVSRFHLERVRLSRNFLAVLPHPTLYKVETRKKFWIHASNIVCGVRGGVGPVWIENAPEKQKSPKTFVHDCSYDTSSRFLLNSLGWDNLSVRRAKQKANLMCKCINNLALAYLCNLFAPRTPIYYFRNAKKKLMLPKPRTDYLKCSFSYSGAQPLLWNNLPEEIRTSNSLGLFIFKTLTGIGPTSWSIGRALALLQS